MLHYFDVILNTVIYYIHNYNIKKIINVNYKYYFIVIVKKIQQPYMYSNVI